MPATRLGERQFGVISTGLTNISGTITANLSVGVSGGQSVIGGTASGNSLTLSSTSHATKGKLLFGTSAYDEVNNRLGIGTASPSNPLHIASSLTASSGSALIGNISGTLTAAANSDSLIGFHINPTFSNGAFTGVSDIFLKCGSAFTFGINGTAGRIQSLTNSTDFVGKPDNTGTFNFYGGSDWDQGSGITVAGKLHSVWPNRINFVRGAYVQSGFISSNGNWILNTGDTDAGYKLDISGTTRTQGDFTISDAKNIILGTSTGNKIGTATSQKIGFWNASPIVQPTTGVAAATLVGGGGTALTDTDTFDGYTLKQIVKALRNIGLLA